MDNQTKKVFGAWIQAIGTVIAAIGSTPSIIASMQMRKDISLVGNVLQAAGNALQADAEEEMPFAEIGNEIQAVGNSTVAAGLVLDVEKETEQRLIITGNWLQALGGTTVLGELLEESPSKSLFYHILGNLLQVTGNSLQAISGGIELVGDGQSEKDPAGVNKRIALEVNGSWIQAVGSILSLLGIQKEAGEEKQICQITKSE